MPQIASEQRIHIPKRIKTMQKCVVLLSEVALRKQTIERMVAFLLAIYNDFYQFSSKFNITLIMCGVGWHELRVEKLSTCVIATNVLFKET